LEELREENVGVMNNPLNKEFKALYSNRDLHPIIEAALPGTGGAAGFIALSCRTA
jgi:hypothetical protein